MGLNGIETDVEHLGNLVLRLLVFRDGICVFSDTIEFFDVDVFLNPDDLKGIFQNKKPKHIYADRFEFLLLDIVPIREPPSEEWSKTVEVILDRYEFSLP